MAITKEEKNVVWGFSNEQLSLNATFVWQYMATNDDIEWSSDTGAADISSGVGGSLSTSEVENALEELNEKDLISSPTFKVASPSS